MIVAITTLPIIEIPVKGNILEGNDSLLSIVQMPRGCPVATVAINNSVNAAQLAVRILSLDDVDIRKKRCASRRSNSLGNKKAERMERVGFEAYDSEKDYFRDLSVQNTLCKRRFVAAKKNMPSIIF